MTGSWFVIMIYHAAVFHFVAVLQHHGKIKLQQVFTDREFHA